jgi:hypothetical protein
MIDQHDKSYKPENDYKKNDREILINQRRIRKKRQLYTKEGLLNINTTLVEEGISTQKTGHS